MPTSIPIRPCPRLPALQLSQDQQRLRTSTHLYSSSLKSKSTSSLWKKKKKMFKHADSLRFSAGPVGVWLSGGTGLCHRPLLPDACLRAGEGPFVEFKKKKKQTPKTEKKKTTQDHRIPLRFKRRKGHFFAIVTNIPPAHLTAKKKNKKQQDRTEDTRSARSDGHKTLYQSIRPPQNRGDSGLVAVAAGPGGRRALPSPRAGEAVPRGHPAGDRGVGSGGERGAERRPPGCGGPSGAGGLRAVHGDVAAAAALAVLLVRGDLGRLNDQQPFRRQGGEDGDGIHLVGQPGAGTERQMGLGAGVAAWLAASLLGMPTWAGSAAPAALPESPRCSRSSQERAGDI